MWRSWWLLKHKSRSVFSACLHAIQDTSLKRFMLGQVSRGSAPSFPGTRARTEGRQRLDLPGSPSFFRPQTRIFLWAARVRDRPPNLQVCVRGWSRTTISEVNPHWNTRLDHQQFAQMFGRGLGTPQIEMKTGWLPTWIINLQFGDF